MGIEVMTDGMGAKYTDVLPSVAVIIPCLNEQDCIESVVNGFRESSYARVEQIMVVDGGSRDRTRDLVRKIAACDARVELLENPYKFQSYALNIALAHCTSDVYLRADAHCVYGKDYVQRCIDTLLTTGALNVGGAQRFIAGTRTQAAIAIAVRSPFGSGGAAYRKSDFDGFADTVFLGCFWTRALREIGGYDPGAITNEDYGVNLLLRLSTFSEVNVTNQDAELNRRLRRNCSNAIYVSSRIVVGYFPRKSLSAVAKQYFKYGRGRALTSIRHREIVCRGALPALGVSCAMGILFAAAWCSAWKVTAIAAAIAFCILGIEALRVCLSTRGRFAREVWRGETDAPDPLVLVLRVWACLLIMPVTHGSGFLFQVIKVGVMRRVGW